MLKLMEKDHWALFVGQWPPTFLLFGLYHRLSGRAAADGEAKP